MARTHFKGTIRKRICPVYFTNQPHDWNFTALSSPKTPLTSPFHDQIIYEDINENKTEEEKIKFETPIHILNEKNRKVGQIFGVHFNLGLAMLRFANITPGEKLRLDLEKEVFVQTFQPDWWQGPAITNEN